MIEAIYSIQCNTLTHWLLYCLTSNILCIPGIPWYPISSVIILLTVNNNILITRWRHQEVNPTAPILVQCLPKRKERKLEAKESELRKQREKQSRDTFIPEDNDSMMYNFTPCHSQLANFSPSKYNHVNWDISYKLMMLWGWGWSFRTHCVCLVRVAVLSDCGHQLQGPLCEVLEYLRHPEGSTLTGFSQSVSHTLAHNANHIFTVGSALSDHLSCRQSILDGTKTPVAPKLCQSCLPPSHLSWCQQLSNWCVCVGHANGSVRQHLTVHWPAQESTIEDCAFAACAFAAQDIHCSVWVRSCARYSNLG